MLVVYLRGVSDNPTVVDEVFHEAIVVAWQNIDRFDTQRSFGCWLRGIARKLMLAHHRRQGVGPALCSPEVLDVLDTRWEALQRQSGDTLLEKLSALEECIGQLPPKYRRAIDMRYLQENRGTSLAAVLETTMENSKKLLQRGRAMLAMCMGRGLSRRELDHDEREPIQV